LDGSEFHILPINIQGRALKGDDHHIAIMNLLEYQDSIIKGITNVLNIGLKAFVITE
jgi:hypothetical protein